MKKFVLTFIAFLLVVVVAFIVVTPIEPDTCLDAEIKFAKSEYFETLCAKADINLIESIQDIFEEQGIKLSEEEAEIVLQVILDFEYTIHEVTKYDTYAIVSVTVTTVDVWQISKEQIKDNIGNLIVSTLMGKDAENEVLVKEVIEELENAPKNYIERVDVRMNLIDGIFYIPDTEKNSDFYNALFGGILYKLQMLDEPVQGAKAHLIRHFLM